MPHILVVDDDPAVTNMLRRGLAYEGYSPLLGRPDWRWHGNSHRTWSSWM
jgi:CheY-like chemotaxis protein